MEINLNNFSDAYDFVAIAERCIGEVMVKSKKYAVNGKSWLGLLSLDLRHPVTVEVSKPEELEQFEKFRIKV